MSTSDRFRLAPETKPVRTWQSIAAFIIVALLFHAVFSESLFAREQIASPAMRESFVRVADEYALLMAAFERLINAFN